MRLGGTASAFGFTFGAPHSLLHWHVPTWAPVCSQHPRGVFPSVSASLPAAQGPTGVFKSVLDTSRTDGGKRRDEIFVDVVERVTCTFNASGYIVSSQVRPGSGVNVS